MGPALDRVPDLASDLDRIRDLDLASTLAHTSALSLANELELDFISASAHAGSLADALDRACSRVRVLERVLDLDLASASALERAHDLYRSLDFALERALSLSRDLIFVLDRNRALERSLDLARDLALALERALDIDLDLSCELTTALVFLYALDRGLTIPAKPRPRRWRQLGLNKQGADQGDVAKEAIHRALLLYIDLLVIKRRKEGKLPAWEGILLVKENKQKEH